MHTEDSDFKNFLFHGVLGKLTPGMQIDGIINSLGEPKSIGDSYNQFTPFVYKNLVLYINNGSLYSFEIYFDDCLESGDEVSKCLGISWYKEICGKSFQDIKLVLENNNILGRRIIFNVDIPESGLEQYWEIYPSKIRIWFDEDGRISRMVFEPSGLAGVSYTEI